MLVCFSGKVFGFLTSQLRPRFVSGKLVWEFSQLFYNLRAKQVFVEHETCSLCQSAPETVLHLFSQCPYTRSVFQSLPGMIEVCYPSNRTFSNFFEWLLFCSQTLSKDIFHQFLFLISSIWWERNKRVWEGKEQQAGDLFLQSQARLHDYQFHRRKSSPFGDRSGSLCWQKPPIGWLKVNMDGAFVVSEQLGGIGVIIRDDEGSCVGWQI